MNDRAMTDNEAVRHEFDHGRREPDLLFAACDDGVRPAAYQLRRPIEIWLEKLDPAVALQDVGEVHRHDRPGVTRVADFIDASGGRTMHGPGRDRQVSPDRRQRRHERPTMLRASWVSS